MYSDNRRNLGGSVSCQSNHLAHLYNNTMRKSGVIVEGLFLTFAQQIFHSEAISYCFAIALFDPLLNKKTETICLRNDFCFSGGDEEDRPTCCRNGRHAPRHRNSPPDCFYCFAIALFDPLLNKKTETICLRNDFCFSGGDEEDRTLDLTDANRTLSQLSYAPVFLTQIIIFFLFVFVKIFSFNPRQNPSLAKFTLSFLSIHIFLKNK